MLYKTHIGFSLSIFNVSALTISFFNEQTKELILSPNYYLLFVVLIFSSIFPDIDTPYSKISKFMPNFILFFFKFFKHRGFTHTIFGIIFFSILFYFILNDFNIHNKLLYVFVFTFGYTLHIIGDMVTYAGINSFLFFDKKNIKLKCFNSFLVGSMYEKNLYIIFLTINLLFFGYLVYITN